jgi:hypothetical protein
MLTRALFYPHIHFRSRRWLRTALLYYDDISRIVPPGVEPDTLEAYREFSSEPTELLDDVRMLQEARFLVDEHPKNIGKAADEFLDFVVNSLTDCGKRRALFPALMRLARGRLFSIHPGKIDPYLIDRLRELNLAKDTRDLWHDAYNVEFATAVLYMGFLANQMSGNRQLVSDNPVYQSLIYRLGTGSTVTASQQDGEFRLAAAVFRAVTPEVERTPVQALLRLREQCAAERHRFQDKMAEFAKDIGSAKNQDDAENAVCRHASKISDEVETLKDKLRSSGIAYATSLFSVSVPSYLTAAWGFGVKSAAAIVAAGAVAISASTVKYCLDRRAAKRESPYTYLISTSKWVSAERMVQDIVTLNLNPHDDDPWSDSRKSAAA